MYSRASKDYVRIQNADGSFVPESYLLKEGGNYGGPRVDKTIDLLNFNDITTVIAKPLQDMGYVPSEGRGTKLLILVYWGVTVVPNDISPKDSRDSVTLAAAADSSLSGSRAFHDTPEGAVDAQQARSLLLDSQTSANMEAGQDGHADAKNANLLGYTDEIFRLHVHDPNLTVLEDEIENDRYYVVLLAYDYQAASRFGVHRLLWETRFSIPEQGNDFSKAFPLMASIAGRYFGLDSHGLIHHNLADTNVEIGTPKSLGALPEK
ncbi:MAG TPA: hypothetical protein VFE25_12435 [Opitutaceae bacterium]|nr:hypothetical protein [Opitutaceae bacterium]